MDDLVYYIHLVNGTAFAAYFTPEKRQILSDVLLNGQRIFGYRSTFEFGATGRNITRKGGVNNVSATMLNRMIQNDPEHAAEYQAWMEHLGGAPFPVPGNQVLLEVGYHDAARCQLLSVGKSTFYPYQRDGND